MAVIGIVRLSPGQVGYFDELTRIHLTISNSEKPVLDSMNTTNLKRAVKSGRIRLVSGSLDPETNTNDTDKKVANHEVVVTNAVPDEKVDKEKTNKVDETNTANETKTSNENAAKFVKPAVEDNAVPTDIVVDSETKSDEENKVVETSEAQTTEDSNEDDTEADATEESDASDNVENKTVAKTSKPRKNSKKAKTN